MKAISTVALELEGGALGGASAAPEILMHPQTHPGIVSA